MGSRPEVSPSNHRRLTDWARLQHEFPNDCICYSLIQVSLYHTVSFEYYKEERTVTHEINCCFLVSVILSRHGGTGTRQTKRCSHTTIRGCQSRDGSQTGQTLNRVSDAVDRLPLVVEWIMSYNNHRSNIHWGEGSKANKSIKNAATNKAHYKARDVIYPWMRGE